MATQRSSLTKFSVKGPGSPAGSTGAPGLVPVTRGKNQRVGVAVRLSHEDWYRVSEFAMRERTSLQRLLVCGISELMRQKGLPPLQAAETGTG